MAKHINPAESAYKAGRRTITSEEAVGLRGKKKTKKEKEALIKRLLRYMKMGALGSRYRPPEEELPRAVRKYGQR